MSSADDPNTLQEPPREQERPVESAADGLPTLEPLCEMQASIARAYAELLGHLSGKLRQADSVQAVGLGILLERLQNDSTWAVSEVRRKNEFKLRRQRYVSQDVFDRWRDLQEKKKKTLGSFDVDASGQTLRHEHVVQREGLGLSLRALVDVDQVAAVLARVTSCVVTKAEHTRLGNVAKDIDGWDRYRQAQPPVGVYDRKEACWWISRSLAEAQRCG